MLSLSKTLYPLLGTGSTQEDRKSSQHDCKIVDWDALSLNTIKHCFDTGCFIYMHYNENVKKISSWGRLDFIFSMIYIH